MKRHDSKLLSPKGSCLLTQTPTASGRICHDDVADLVVKVWEKGETSCNHKELSAIDTSLNFDAMSVDFEEFVV